MQIMSSILTYQIQDHFDAKNKLAKYSRCWNTNEEHLSENTWFCQNTCQHQNTLTISPFGIFLAKTPQTSIYSPFLPRKGKGISRTRAFSPFLHTSYLIFQLRHKGPTPPACQLPASHKKSSL